LLDPAATPYVGEPAEPCRPLTKPFPDLSSAVPQAPITLRPPEIPSAPGEQAFPPQLTPEKTCEPKTAATPAEPKAICAIGIKAADLPDGAPEPVAVPEIGRQLPPAGETGEILAASAPAKANIGPEISQEPPPFGEAGKEPRTTARAEPDVVLEISQEPPPASEIEEEPPAPATPVPKRPRRAIHRDRRGARRTLPVEAAAPSATTPQEYRLAEAKLRLALDPLRHSVRLSLVLSRPEGFPETVSIDLGGPQTLGAYDETRYDDLDLAWTAELLGDELRFSDPTHRVQWIRSARPLHLFAQSELDLISVPAARPGIQHAVICHDRDAAAVAAAAAKAGSPPLLPVTGWSGIPRGWTVFSGYTPVLRISPLDDPRLRSLDIGSSVEIHLRGGLRIRAEHFAEGKPPSIFVEPLPSDCQVLINGWHAFQSQNGAWAAQDSEKPGQHLVDVIGGPSLTYTVERDPGTAGDWLIPEEALHPFGAPPPVQAAIIGAHANPISRSAVFATEPVSSVVAIGSRAGVPPLGSRPDIPAAVAAIPFEPAFVIVSWGLRRHQGHILYLGASGPARIGHRPDMNWVSTVIAAAARRLDVRPDDDAAKRFWRSAVTAARRARRLRK
jgi:hypothetical protein